MTKKIFYEVKISNNPIQFSLIILIILNFIIIIIWKMIIKLNLNFYVIWLNSLIRFLLLMFYLTKIYFKDLIKENFEYGYFREKKKNIVVIGFLLFIRSECIIFISLFWRYIHNAYTADIFVGNFWPPKGFNNVDPTRIIIFGTAILLRSRLIIMISHTRIVIKNDLKKRKIFIFMCLFIGIIFVDIQITEFTDIFLKLNFRFNDTIFRNSFISTTSLHASHVIIGIIGLWTCFNIILNKKFNIIIVTPFELRVWYWHFVDYIWILVFSLFYYLNN